MRRLGIVLFAVSTLSGIGHLVFVSAFSGETVLTLAVDERRAGDPLPFDLPRRESHSARATVALDPARAPYRASLVLWGSGLSTHYGLAVLDPEGNSVFEHVGLRRKRDSPGRSTSSFGSFVPERAAEHTLVVAVTERPGVVPSGAELELRAGVASFDFRLLGGCTALAMLGLAFSARAEGSG